MKCWTGASRDSTVALLQSTAAARFRSKRASGGTVITFLIVLLMFPKQDLVSFHTPPFQECGSCGTSTHGIAVELSMQQVFEQVLNFLMQLLDLSVLWLGPLIFGSISIYPNLSLLVAADDICQDLFLTLQYCPTSGVGTGLACGTIF